MPFSNDIYKDAAEKKQDQRREALDGAARRKAAFIIKTPMYAELERELSRTGMRLVRAIFNSKGTDASGGAGDSKNESYIRAKVDEIGAFNMEIQEEMRRILAANGHDENYLEPKWTCKTCCDTGINDGKMCECMRQIMKRIAYDSLNSVTPLSLSTFDSFSLDGYPDIADSGKTLSPRHFMEITYKKCREYSKTFSMKSKSLLFQGGVGLGKTHLSLAIAGEVIGRGYDVVYGTAQDFFVRIERERFGKSGDNEDTLSHLCDVDLLIIDDLGTEFSTPFTASVLHEIVNTRLLSGRPTIISTNLTPEGMTGRYSERIVSRIFGSYARLHFFGKDMRSVLRKSTQI